MSRSRTSSDVDTAGRLVVISGPSGVGKSTVVRRLLDRHEGRTQLSVSATTRAPRPGEQDGVSYHFISAEEFRQRREAGEFLECFEVYSGDWYGTLESEVRPGLEAGKWVILEVDVQGARAVMQKYPDAETIFIRPGSLAELERRLRQRKTETEAAIQRRLAVARQEIEQAHHYRHEVVNDTVDQAVQEISQILEQRGS